MKTAQFANQENGKDEIIKITNTSTKTMIAKNFINEFMYRNYRSTLKLGDIYDKYRAILKDFGCLTTLQISGFVSLLKSADLEIDHCNSIFYSASVVGLEFKSEEEINPIRLFDKIKLANLKKYGIKFVDGIKGNKALLSLNAEAYINGMRSGKEFETFDINNVISSEPVEEVETANTTDFITEEVVDIQDTPIAETIAETKDTEMTENDLQMYKNLLKAKIKYAIAEQEYQFELAEFKIYKLKSLEKELETKSINEETLLKLINDIK